MGETPTSKGCGPAILIGLGNPVCGDDAVGLRVAERVAAILAERPVPGARVATSTRGGFELLDLLTGADRAIVVDCMVGRGHPGAVHELTLEQLAGSARLVGSHDIGLAQAVELGRLVGAPMPRQLEIVGVEASDTETIREALSPAVAAAVEPLAAQLYERLVRGRGLDCRLPVSQYPQ